MIAAAHRSVIFPFAVIFHFEVKYVTAENWRIEEFWLYKQRNCWEMILTSYAKNVPKSIEKSIEKIYAFFL